MAMVATTMVATWVVLWLASRNSNDLGQQLLKVMWIGSRWILCRRVFFEAYVSLWIKEGLGTYLTSGFHDLGWKGLSLNNLRPVECRNRFVDRSRTVHKRDWPQPPALGAVGSVRNSLRVSVGCLPVLGL